jgi:hypothetical protein
MIILDLDHTLICAVYKPIPDSTEIFSRENGLMPNESRSILDSQSIHCTHVLAALESEITTRSPFPRFLYNPLNPLL